MHKNLVVAASRDAESDWVVGGYRRVAVATSDVNVYRYTSVCN